MAGVTYALNFVNNSSNTGDVCVYQSDPNINVPGVMSLAWFTKKTVPNSEAMFDWDVNYNFVWSETGLLTAGVRFTASQRPPADLTASNQITLDHQGAYSFVSQRTGPVAGNLYIDATNNVPLNQASVGIGMSGVGTYAVQAQPNLQYIFTPHPVYWITFGNFVRGQVLDVTTITQKSQVDFPPGIYSMTAILGRDNKWTIKPTASVNAMFLKAQESDREARWAAA